MIRKSFYQVLIDRKIFTQQRLKELELEAQSANLTLENYLIENNLIKEEDLAKALSEQFNIPVVSNIQEKMTDPEILSKIPIKFLRDNLIMPLHYDDQLILATAKPYNFEPIDELTLILGGNAKVAVATRASIIDAINRYYPIEGTQQMIEELQEEVTPELDLSTIKEEDILSMASEAPIIKLVNHILYQAVKREASDIHIEPFEKEIHVRYRIDGVLYNVLNPPKRIQSALTSRIKIMANLNIAEKRIPLDGRINIKVAEKAIDIRVSTLPVSFGERIVMRLLDKSKTFVTLDKLGFSERDYKVINNSIEQPNGIILVTGPTGSGKTTTLYSVLNKLNSPDVNIITVEDPVEYQLAGIGQVQVKESVGLTFAAALRSILRQDPDIIMIGETRDQETAQIAIQSALTGHLVLSTLHTNSAAGSITRLIDMGVEPYLIASSLVCSIAQRLVRKLCPSCKRAYQPTQEILKRLPISLEELKSWTFYEPVGCEQCSNTGFKGRIPIFEIMLMTTDIGKLTVERADAKIIETQAEKDGMTTLFQDGLRKVKSGLTTIEEVLAVATSSDQALDLDQTVEL
ncbi:type II secretion system ATPase GspE [Candidatus Babela massiliensis]|uniref:protein-secreting ATPase n=1 Tax=Candidatus Babela massiliensis TaxID=673862 RepID=V6DJE9_9BACT|nr:type II secretion system ATPase GspE [Candidatus Babela massiliensis]CDK30641.1 Type II secretory pathway ATPase PulE/Tfp [Candidatus Babela massiliensis]